MVQALRTGSFGCSLEDQSRHIAFAIKKLARLEHHSTIQHFISKQLRMEIEFLRDKLDPRSDVLWETPIGHIIKRTPTAVSFGDSSLTGMGGYSLGMKFWWHMSVPEVVQRRTIGAILISNYKKEEDIVVQRLPLNSAIFAELQRSASAAKSNHSEKRVLYDITCLGRFIGNRLSEIGQKSPSKIDYHVYPSGKTVIKAFTALDFGFIDSSGNVIPSYSLTEESADLIARVKVTFRIQKNRRNGQSIKVPADKDHPLICPARAALRLVLRARSCNQPDDRPVACYMKGDKLVYIIGTRISALFKEAVKVVNPTVSKADLARYSAHSIRVWACVLLDEAGMSPEFIMSRLRWMGNSFRMYLRDTEAIQNKHLDVLREASQAIIDLIEFNEESLLSQLDTGMSVVSLDEDMDDDYEDDMD